MLLVEDEPAEARLVMETLARAGADEFDITHVTRLDEGLELLGTQRFDAVVLDLSLPDGDGLDNLATLQRHSHEAAIVVRSGFDDEATAREAVRRGAQEYLVKGRHDDFLLVRALRYSRERREAARYMALGPSFDGVTGLPDHDQLRDRLHRVLVRAERDGHRLAILSVGVDRLAAVRNSLGLEAGDALLRVMARRLTSHFRAGDMVARGGEDEFVVLLEPVESSEHAAPRAREALDAIAGPVVLGEHRVLASASVGISLHPNDGTDVDRLLDCARSAMHRARSTGRDSYGFFESGVSASVADRLDLESGLQAGLERDEFVVDYQPLIRLADGTIEGVEALVRWNHPERGLVPPADFVGAAEETGLIVDIGRHVLRTACAQARAWEAAGVPRLRMAVNLSARQFHCASLVDDVAQVLAETRLPPSCLELELTESLFADLDLTREVFRRLKGLGVRLAIDDFGQGFSSLRYLTRFPVDTLKIDRCFIDAVDRDPQQQAIVTSVLSLARQLDLEVVAEGIETDRQLEFLRGHGCPLGQGFLFSRPVPPQALEGWLRSHARTPARRGRPRRAPALAPARAGDSRSPRRLRAVRAFLFGAPGGAGVAGDATGRLTGSPVRPGRAGDGYPVL